VAQGRDITDDNPPCQGETVEQLLRDGVCFGDFLRYSPRVFTRAPRPSSWAECNNAQSASCCMQPCTSYCTEVGKKDSEIQCRSASSCASAPSIQETSRAMIER
jgi:hypothetical protein